MAHFLRELSDEEWALARTVPAAKIRNIDEKTRKAIAESGGSWEPSSPLIIDGAGIEMQSGLVLQGGVAKPAPGRNYRFGDDDYFSFITVDRAIAHLPLDLFPTPQSLPATVRLTKARTSSSALLTRRAGARFFIPLRTLNGTRFVGVSVNFAVGSAHAEVPSLLSRMRLVRIHPTGEVSPHPSVTTSTNYDRVEGWVSPTRPATGADWYDSGALKTLTVSLDADDGEAVDRASYDYAIEWQEESGKNAFGSELGNYIYTVIATYRSNSHQPA